MEQIRQIYRWKSLLFGLVRLENYGGLFAVGEGMQIKKKIQLLFEKHLLYMVLPVAKTPLAQMLTDHNWRSFTVRMKHPVPIVTFHVNV